MRWKGSTFAALVAILGTMLSPQETRACSVSRVLTAAEIVEGADAIVRAKTIRFQRQDQHGGFVTFEIQEVLKGRVEGDTIALPGTTDRYDGRNDARPPYNFVRLGGRHGNCYAYDYKIDAEFLLFMRKGTTNWAPLAATNEEIAGSDDPWVWWVKGYLASKPSNVPVDKPTSR